LSGGASVSPAPILRRIAAYATDCSLLFAGLIVVQLGLLPVNPAAAAIRAGGIPHPGILHGWVAATVTLPFWLYFTLSFASRRGATPGMRLFGARIVAWDGGAVSRGSAAARAAILLLPFELNHAVLFHLGPRGGEPGPAFFQGLAMVGALLAVYLGSALLDPLRRSVHDRAAGTIVLAADPAGIFG
jgi:uncharacterized RDD family membrane protein YckC